MTEYPILTALVMMALGLVMFAISFMSVAIVADMFNFYFANISLMAVYVASLVLGVFYWQPLGMIATVLLWGTAGVILYRDWRER